jgi:A/G-specific adenine glycosylase
VSDGVQLAGPLLRWYAANARDLPWRTTDATPWGVLVSEVMLQQTPVSRVRPVWTDWLARWPDAAALAGATPGDAIRHWGRLGYPRRALRLHQAATQIVERHDGEVPSSYADLLALQGVGTYTAAAVASFAFGKRHAVVDTNVRRVQARAMGGAALPAPSLTAAELRRASGLLPEDDHAVARWNIALMELGALICTARAPRCPDCPLRPACAWVAAGSPPYEGKARRRQAWRGTDRQVRGRILAALRGSTRPVRLEQLEAVAQSGARSVELIARDQAGRDQADRDQAGRCLDGLVGDGLVEALPGGGYQLPG